MFFWHIYLSNMPRSSLQGEEEVRRRWGGGEEEEEEEEEGGATQKAKNTEGR